MPHRNTPYVQAYQAKKLADGRCIHCGQRPMDIARSQRSCTVCLEQRKIRKPRGRRTQTWSTSCKVCGLKLTGKQRSYCASHDYVHPKARAMKNHKLTSDQYDALATACEICGSTKRLCIDHDHVTGKVRGRLCNRCNKRIERVVTNSWLAKAVQYLR